MLTDAQARIALKNILRNHLDNQSPELVQLESLLDNLDRTIPIRGALETIRGNNISPYTEQELEIIKDLLYLYG